MNKLNKEQTATIFAEAKKNGSLADAVLAHADEYGISNIDYAFGPSKLFPNPPAGEGSGPSVSNWMNLLYDRCCIRTPFRRLKTVTVDEYGSNLRPAGYTKGEKKSEADLKILRRITTPTTLYTKKTFDNDDIIDIDELSSGFDFVQWIKSNMETQMRRELARDILIGDGRVWDDPDKVDEAHLRPVWGDSSVYVTTQTINGVTTIYSDAELAAEFIGQFKAARATYNGVDLPILFISDSLLAAILELTDDAGALLYPDELTLCRILRVGAITPVTLFDKAARYDEAAETYARPLGIALDIGGYGLGGMTETAEFHTKFDIDYNLKKYLLEQRVAGALIRPDSAIVIEEILPAPAVGIEVTTPPTRTEYTAGETFDPTGMVVQTVDAFGTPIATVPSENLEYSPDGPLTTEDTEVVITAAIEEGD